MTEVYVDVAAASMEQGGDASRAIRPSEPEAIRALRYLAESGIRVVVIATDDARPDQVLQDLAAEVVRAVPSRPRGPAWYLTSDIDRCRGSSARLRTVLIGAQQPSGSVRRCDAVARDVQAAAMEILAQVAMPPRASAGHS
ncbi:MAG TPA: hypothetical protein VL749_00480 [Patescibacteria group bacterium]|nr:hypothetical protein [Patescibacteria group bacterium]